MFLAFLEYACIIFPDPPKANEKGKSERVFTLPSRPEELLAPPLHPPFAS